MDKLYIIIPAYNEEKNIEQCVEDWYPIVEKYNAEMQSRLVIVDDGSKDNTLKVLTNISADKELLTVLTKKNGGHGSAVLYGYQYAIMNKADYIFQTDSDRQTNPKEFPAFWDKREEYDVILGNRVKREDGKIRKLVESIVCLLIRLVFGVKAPDANAPFRLMKTDVVKRYTSRLSEDYNIPNIMLTVFFLFYKEKVLFLPITFKPRVNGKNSINIRKIIKIGYRAMSDFRNFKNGMNGEQEEE